MTHIKANKSKVLTLILGLTMCLALMLGIVFASPTSTVYAAGETLTPYDIIYINNKPLNNGYYLKTSNGDQLNGNPPSDYVAKYKDGVLTLNNFNGGTVGILLHQDISQSTLSETILLPVGKTAYLSMENMKDE